jgi:hypothetical protein
MYVNWTNFSSALPGLHGQKLAIEGQAFARDSLLPMRMTLEGSNRKFGKRVVTLGLWTIPPVGYTGDLRKARKSLLTH